MAAWIAYWGQWILFPIGLTGQILVTRKKAIGFLLGLVAQLLWIAFALAIHKPGMITGTLFYAATYWFGFYTWKFPDRAEKLRRRFSRKHREAVRAQAQAGSCDSDHVEELAGNL